MLPPQFDAIVLCGVNSPKVRGGWEKSLQWPPLFDGTIPIELSKFCSLEHLLDWLVYSYDLPDGRYRIVGHFPKFVELGLIWVRRGVGYFVVRGGKKDKLKDHFDSKAVLHHNGLY